MKKSVLRQIIKEEIKILKETDWEMGYRNFQGSNQYHPRENHIASLEQLKHLLSKGRDIFYTGKRIGNVFYNTYKSNGNITVRLEHTTKDLVINIKDISFR